MNDSSFRCLGCNVFFPDKVSYKNHQHTGDSNYPKIVDIGTLFSCKIHNVYYTQQHDYDAHLMNHFHNDYIPSVTIDKKGEALATAEKEIIEVTDELRDLLIEKNRKYGNSALEPTRVFSKASSNEQLKVRIDDKLSRIISGQSDEDEDVINDLLGYLVLLKICIRREKTV